jgi:hypothetical protein
MENEMTLTSPSPGEKEEKIGVNVGLYPTAEIPASLIFPTAWLEPLP